ncbi:Endonuclease-reverse transcriptase [Fasciola hepatica]|uniref:Endonuclease-reverse transcriptase n=1 Tax=Fasciola hepatica TaxID=6192 RepID=A0A4E0RE49_FASHE|nr:Endonuclease-reverse transcriptase [Fasciola hepatica]
MGDMLRLSVVEHGCLRSVARIWWEHRINNDEVQRKVLGSRIESLDETLKLTRLRWLGHVLRMSPDRIPRRAMFTEAGTDWKMSNVGQKKDTNNLTCGLDHVGRVRLPGWGLIYPLTL